MLQNIDLIRARENLIFRSLGISPKNVFNNSQDVNFCDPGFSIVTRLKQAANNIQTQAIYSNGKTVDYGSLAGSKIYRDFRNKLTPQLRYFDPATIKTTAEQMAFWINLYNVLVMDSVIQLSVDSSITEGIGGILRYFRQAAYDIGGFRTSLEDIEQGILRRNRGNPFIPGAQFSNGDPRMAWVVAPMDPRIHFALNCASKSCPPIGIYTPEQIDRQLDLAARNFITQEVSYDSETNTLKLSRIFQWFAVDFGGKAGVLKFILRYLPDERHRLITMEHKHLQVKYKPYNWGLNRCE